MVAVWCVEEGGFRAFIEVMCGNRTFILFYMRVQRDGGEGLTRDPLVHYRIYLRYVQIAKRKV